MHSSIRKLTLLGALLALNCAPAIAQGRYFWTALHDGPGAGDDQAQTVAIAPDGTVVVAASSRGAASADLLVLAYDSHGRLLWQQRLDDGTDEYASDLVLDPATSDVFVAGTSAWNGNTGKWLLARIGASTGNLAWRVDYAGPQSQGAAPLDLAAHPGGGIVVTGYAGTSMVHDALVARFDASGTLAWAQLLNPGAAIGYGAAVVVDPASSDVIVRAAASVFATQWTLHRLSASGSPVWSKPIGASDIGAHGPYLDSASNLVYAINVSSVGGREIAKLDPAGNLVWSVDATSLFGANSGTAAIRVAPGDDVVAVGTNSVLARLAPQGGVRWTRSLPPVAWFDTGSAPSGLEVDPNGDAVVRLRGFVPGTSDDADAVARWDRAGNYLWSQAVRGFEPGDEVRTLGMALAPQGSVVIAGFLKPDNALMDAYVVAVRDASELTCFGDGSTGPCPCGNNVPAGMPSGCAKGAGIPGARLDDQGIASLGSDSLRFFATGMPPSGIAILLQGQLTAVPIPFQDGLMCIGGRRVRIYASGLHGPYLDLGPAGAPRVSARSAAAGDVIPPGTSRTYQLFYRGPTSACQAGNGNLTNAVRVDWSQ